MFFAMLGHLHAILWWLAGVAASWKAEAAYLTGRGARRVWRNLRKPGPTRRITQSDALPASDDGDGDRRQGSGAQNPGRSALTEAEMATLAGGKKRGDRTGLSGLDRTELPSRHDATSPSSAWP
jgi:hypothetical protein